VELSFGIRWGAEVAWELFLSFAFVDEALQSGGESSTYDYMYELEQASGLLNQGAANREEHGEIAVMVIVLDVGVGPPGSGGKY
jgi:hypothetical protein